jgi:citrate lyase beta subunit
VSGFGDQFRLTLITADPILAAAADHAGVDRIGLDLERLGKAERQAGAPTRLSSHQWEDFDRVSRALVRARLFARLNPVHGETALEIEAALRRGAQVVMLPFFRTAGEVDHFVRMVDGRAKVIILLETAAAALRVRDVLAVPGIDEVMLGLNDLRFQFGVSNHFEVLASPLLDTLAGEVRRAGLPLAIGGVACADDTDLPVAPDLIYAQFPRLGATGAWLARSFFRGDGAGENLGQKVADVRRRLSEWAVMGPDVLDRARSDLAAHARRLDGRG